MATKERLTEQVREYLDGKKIEYQVIKAAESLTWIRYKIQISNVMTSITENIFIQDDHMKCVILLPIKAQKENYAAVAEYLHRANKGKRSGAFEFDYGDGTVIYRDSLSAHGVEAAQEDIEATIIIPMQMMKVYGDGLVKNIKGEGNPEEDIARAEDTWCEREKSLPNIRI